MRRERVVRGTAASPSDTFTGDMAYRAALNTPVATCSPPGGGYALPGLHPCPHNPKLNLQRRKESDKQNTRSGSLVRLKIAEALTGGRGEAQGRAERA